MTPPPGHGRGAVVFVCVDADALGGVQQATHTLAQGLALRGYAAHVAGLRHGGGAPFRYVERPLYERHAPGRGAGRRGVARWWGARTLRGLGEGFAVMTCPEVADVLAGVVPDGLRGIGQYHGSFAQARDAGHLAAVRRHYGALDRAAFLSADDAWRFAEEALLPNAVDLPNPLRTWPATTSYLDVPRVLGVGRLVAVKRFDRLITAFARAARARAGWELHLIGDGPELPRLRACAAGAGVADQVVFRGRVTAAQLGREYLNAAVLGLTSEHEGLPPVVAEAAAYGMPAVAFDVSGGVRSLVLDGTTGALVPHPDLDAFTGALAGLMADPARRRRLGAAARAHAASFRLDPVLDRWEDLFTAIRR
ncbi:glycosyltransferase [Sphaerisporangium aureirubrum]|uniref:Glycosyltransferase n=1 Tax=Sphaerisporangium aureirubrum TaxID=1544736 RepID=A0ABW1NBF7_9ACTN